MTEPFRLTTADARFDPRQPVRVNGFLYHPANQGGPRCKLILPLSKPLPSASR